MKIKNSHIFYILGSIVIFDVLLFVSADPSFEFIHVNIFSDYTIPVFKPIFQSTLFFIPTLALFLFCRPAIFRHWLIWIASWYVPLAVLVVSDTPVYGGSILSLNRTDAALWWSGGLLLITIAYLIVRTYLPRLKTFLVQRYNLD